MRLPDLDLRLYVSKPPFWLVALIVVSMVASWVPLAMIAKHRVSKHRQPRYHIFLDMDNQAKLKTQHESAVFADGRTMRPPVPGTVARGELRADDFFYRGYVVEGASGDSSGDSSGGEAAEVVATYFEGYPDQVSLDMSVLENGRLKYGIFCAHCHADSGNGQGTSQQRAMYLMERGNTATSWTAVANLHDGIFQEEAYPNGKVFNTITHGKGAMRGYKAQITPEDRWAIVAYVRALQLTQPKAPGTDTTAKAEGSPSLGSPPEPSPPEPSPPEPSPSDMTDTPDQ